MCEYTCPDCGTTAEPAAVEKAIVVGCWIIECSSCGWHHVARTAYGHADVNQHRAEAER